MKSAPDVPIAGDAVPIAPVAGNDDHKVTEMVGWCDLDPYRGYLRVLARRCVDRRLQAKLDSSDLVQNTLLRVTAAGEAFQRLPADQQLPYLRRCLKNELHDQRRRFLGEKRNVVLERSLDDVVDASSDNLEGWIAVDGSAPSEQAIKSEMLLLLAKAIDSLPLEQRTAFELKHVDGLTLEATARAMGKETVAQVAGLLRRAKKALRQALENKD